MCWSEARHRFSWNYLGAGPCKLVGGPRTPEAFSTSASQGSIMPQPILYHLICFCFCGASKYKIGAPSKLCQWLCHHHKPSWTFIIHHVYNQNLVEIVHENCAVNMSTLENPHGTWKHHPVSNEKIFPKPSPKCSMGWEHLPSHFPLNVSIFHLM